jgi:ketosteroid isomerase-like protein
MVSPCPRPRRAQVVGSRGSATRPRSFGASLLAILLFGIATPALSADDPAATVDAFHAALAAGDRDAALALLAEDLTVFESGFAERSREEYAGQHLGADMEFSAATEREVVSRANGEAGDAAWVLTETRTTGTFRDREISSLGLETMVLRRIESSWRIVHIHWSARDAE